MAKLKIEEINTLYQAVGFIVLNWGLLEQALDTCVAIVYQFSGGNKIEPTMPRELKRKISFMKESLQTLPELDPLQDGGLGLMQQVTDMKQKRHDLIHGAIISLAAQDGKFEFRHLDAQPNTHKVRKSTFDLKGFPKFSKDLVDLTSQMAGYARHLLDTLD